MELPESFAPRVVRTFGDRGRAWLPTLPELAARCRRRWRLAEGVPAPFMSMNYNRADPARAAAVPEGPMAAAEALLGELLDEPPALLHGDLHHENVLLDARRGWLAVDPKGVIGPFPYQAARFLNNRLPHGATPAHLRAVLARRLELLAAQLDVPPHRLAAAACVDCLLGTSWSLDDEGPADTAPALARADVLRALADRRRT